MFVGGCDPPPSSAEVPWYPRHLPHQVWYEEALIPMDPATQDPRALSHPSHLDLRPSGGWAPDPTAMAKLVWEPFERLRSPGSISVLPSAVT